MRTLVAGTATLMLIATTLWIMQPEDRLFEELGLPPSGEAPHRLVIVFQEADCNGSLQAVRFLHRPAVSEFVSVSGAFDGTRTALARVLTSLPGGLEDLPVEPLTRSQRQQLFSLGYDRTPFLVAFDREGRLRFTGPVPQDRPGAFALLDLLQRSTALGPQGEGP